MPCRTDRASDQLTSPGAPAVRRVRYKKLAGHAIDSPDARVVDVMGTLAGRGITCPQLLFGGQPYEASKPPQHYPSAACHIARAMIPECTVISQGSHIWAFPKNSGFMIIRQIDAC